jgi:hypothetical protein
VIRAGRLISIESMTHTPEATCPIVGPVEPVRSQVTILAFAAFVPRTVVSSNQHCCEMLEGVER